ncbi:hypothetical protein [Anabaena lutea]|uniref:Uncharacterized protein n=1 Tax=Anabaena lutea FACHB-196 TaxID=2692881 RepID=A0ABR8FIT6_9NOST|nr:hypothetical protein [Anabaena lutea]MBD2570019.1 hypothetical protein [Anabaena lutea FACHB-196]
MFRFLSFGLCSITVFAGSAAGQVTLNRGFERALRVGGYDTAIGDSLICYAETNTASTFDLSRLCGIVPARSSGNDGYTGSGSGYSGGGSDGVCNFPDDIARDGSRCGGRARSEKPGGR